MPAKSGIYFVDSGFRRNDNASTGVLLYPIENRNPIHINDVVVANYAIEKMIKQDILVNIFFFCFLIVHYDYVNSQTKISMSSAVGEQRYIDPTGNDSSNGSMNTPWRTIQKGLNSAVAGDTVFVKAGIYFEKDTVGVSGSSSAGFITLRNFQNDSVVIDGSGVSGRTLLTIQNKSYIRIVGLEFRNDSVGDAMDGGGIRIQGWADHIEIRNNTIHDMHGLGDAMGITVYGTAIDRSISNIVIDGNEIYRCDLGRSEALTLNGNVESFQVTNNRIHDVKNIGIDMIGGERMCPDTSKDAARNGICRGNIVYNARSMYEDSAAAGIYIDGGRNILVERNIVYGCNFGIEVGAENRGIIARGDTVRDNLIYSNQKTGLLFGGYADTTGRVQNCYFFNNTVFKNNSLKRTDMDELVIQYAQGNVVKNNIFYSNSTNNLFWAHPTGNINNVLNYNLWHTESPTSEAHFGWIGIGYTTFDAYRAATKQDSNSLFANPFFVNTTLPFPDLHLSQNSPALDRGDPMFTPATNEFDFEGLNRVANGRVDIGAYERQTSTTLQPYSEESIPSATNLLDNYPNPFNPTTTIRYQLSVNSFTTLKVYTVLGKEVATLVNERKEAGKYQVQFDAARFASGVYFYRLQSGSYSATKKLLLLK